MLSNLLWQDSDLLDLFFRNMIMKLLNHYISLYCLVEENTDLQGHGGLFIVTII